MSSAKAMACALVAAAMFQAASAGAAEGGQWSVGVSGGTLGISPEVGYRFGSHGGLRLNGGFFNYDRSEEIDDIDYDGTLKLNSVGLMADLYPFGGSFRLSAGARSSSNRIDLEAVPTGNVEIGNDVFTPAEVGMLRGRVDFKNFAPTVTLGWGGKLASGFTLGFEAGVMLQGSPDFSLEASGGTLSNDPTFLAELEEERAQAEEDAEDFKLWPVLQLHFTYRF
jgi:opacity protein-like surface antigen